MSVKDSDDTDDCLVGETTGLLGSPEMSQDRQNNSHANQRMVEDDSVSVRPESQSNAIWKGP